MTRINIAVLGTGLAMFAFAATGAAAQSAGDDFNDNHKDTTKWGADDHTGNGTLVEASQRLEWRVSDPTAEDETDRPRIPRKLPYDSDWEVRIDLYNNTHPSQPDQVNSFGIDIVNANDDTDFYFGELYSSDLGGGGDRRGFNAEVWENDTQMTNADDGGLAVTHGALKIEFDALTKVIQTYYDIDVSDGYQWIQLASFGVAGAGGDDGNASWGMSGSDRFDVDVYGYSAHMVVAAGTVWGDNFSIEGGVSTVHHPVTLTAPNGGEVWGSGTIQEITWEADAAATSFRLDYSTDGGETWKPIDDGIQATFYQWSIPAALNNVSKAKVRVKGYDANHAVVGKDASDAVFTIQIVVLQAPNGGESYPSGSIHAIQWVTYDTVEVVSSVVLQFSKDNGKTWTKIVKLTENTGFYDWTVPSFGTVKSRCRVRVILKAGDGTSVGKDVSDATFTITPPGL